MVRPGARSRSRGRDQAAEHRCRGEAELALDGRQSAVGEPAVHTRRAGRSRSRFVSATGQRRPTKRVSSSGRSKPAPLNVTAVARVSSGSSAASNAGSSSKSHEELRQREAIAVEPGRAHQERVGAGAAGQTGGLGVEEEHAPGVAQIAVDPRRARQHLERCRGRVAEWLGPVAMGQRILTTDDDDRPLARVEQLTVDDLLHRLGGRPWRAGALDAADHPAEVVEARHPPQAVSAVRRRAAVVLARRPTSFTGPTQDGQPNAHAQAASVSRPRRRRSGRISNNRSARPMPPACAS